VFTDGLIKSQITLTSTGDRAAPAQSLDLTLLQDAQQRDQRIHLNLADFIEEDRPRVRQFKTPATLLNRAGKGTLFVTE
jgi:hypothetical protein